MHVLDRSQRMMRLKENSFICYVLYFYRPNTESQIVGVAASDSAVVVVSLISLVLSAIALIALLNLAIFHIYLGKLSTIVDEKSLQTPIDMDTKRLQTFSFCWKVCRSFLVLMHESVRALCGHVCSIPQNDNA